MFGEAPGWAAFTPQDGRTVRVVAADTGDSWLATLGRLTGTDPDGNACDETAIADAGADPGTEAAATVTGTAADLDCWLWNRPPAGTVRRAGRDDVLTDFGVMLAQGL